MQCEKITRKFMLEEIKFDKQIKEEDRNNIEQISYQKNISEGQKLPDRAICLTKANNMDFWHDFFDKMFNPNLGIQISTTSYLKVLSKLAQKKKIDIWTDIDIWKDHLAALCFEGNKIKAKEYIDRQFSDRKSQTNTIAAKKIEYNEQEHCLSFSDKNFAKQEIYRTVFVPEKMKTELPKTDILFRLYSADENKVEKKMKDISDSIENIKKIKIDNKSPFNKVHIAVWTNKNYQNSDCGKTIPLLQKQKYTLYNPAKVQRQKVLIHDENQGDPFSAILNNVIRKLDKKTENVLIASPENADYFQGENIWPMFEAFERGAHVSGLAINDNNDLYYRYSILQGYLSNTFCMWNIEQLCKAGYFSISEGIKVDSRDYIIGYSPELGLYKYPIQGCEEIRPLVGIIENNSELNENNQKIIKPCIAPIFPKVEAKYRSVAKEVDYAEYTRMKSKIESKPWRQTRIMNSMNIAPSVLEYAVLPYLKQENNKIITELKFRFALDEYRINLENYAKCNDNFNHS